MCQTVSSIDVGFSRESFAPGTHICLVFRDEADRRRIVSKFVESGILSRERVYYFADTAQTSDVSTWLAELDIGILEAQNSAQFTIDEAVSTYCPDGRFVPERMLEEIKTAYSSSHEAGFPNSRVTGEMSWALRDIPGAERLMEYESGVNTVLMTHPITAMCQYDANRFSGAIVFKALQVHPYMVMNGQLVKNPYYIPKE